ncbi:DoxX family protein [Streptomyces sp. OZ13]|uniref:DoxX family protein n=1 Tax=Streptomyces sp. OZ13 TaxID=3452210 RepID=UPI003F8B7BCD
MFTAYLVVTLLAAATSGYSAANHLIRPRWMLDNLASYGVPLTWVPALGVLKGAGVLGLLIGIGWVPIAVAASVGLMLYYVGAVIVIARSGRWAHLPAPLPFLLLVVASLALRLASS